MEHSLFFKNSTDFLKDMVPKYNPLWNMLDAIGDIILRIAENHRQCFTKDGDCIFIGRGTTIAENAVIKGPAIIGPGCEIRPGAYLRENVILGNNCIIGNSTEIKNSVLFDNVQAPHFNYIGDSILGNYVHLGAGVILSNFRLDQQPVTVKDSKGGTVSTGRTKFGAIIGDNTEIGCNSVLNPGTILEKEVIVFPLSNVWGYHKGRTIVRTPVLH
jgi:NDP-sugar pyrophosphorylase family protein